jgi:hypothetical protein
MTENNTSAARTFKAVIVKRMPSHVSLMADGTTVHSDLHQFESGMASWEANLDRAKEQDFFFMWRDGRLFQAATVLGAERVPERFREGDRVRWITSMSIPAWVESLLGQEFDYPHRNPVFYVTLTLDSVTGLASIQR